MISIRFGLTLLACVLLPELSLAMAPKPAPDPFAVRQAEGIAILKQYGDAVVTVELVATISATVNDRSMPPREQKVEVNATVISPMGLTVTALSQIDPRSAFEMVRTPMSGKITFGETDFKEVKIKLSDGTEIPAKVILKDQDLDLAFIVPDQDDAKATSHVFAAFNLKDPASASILENFFNLAHAPKSLQQVPEIIVSTVVGTVEKPRKLYIVVPDTIGCPVVSTGGKILGIAVQHGGGNRPTPVVLPAADVAELAQQALALLPKAETPAASK
jgi:hypothetical protein